MNDNKDYIAEAVDSGSINISEDVIAAIAAVAVMEVEGVAGMSANLSANVAELLGKKSLSKGIKVEKLEEGLKISASVLVKFGVSIPDIARKIQTNISEALKNMTGLDAVSVNVNVTGVAFEPEKQQ
ncbi:MAG: Asp23/Gls24 family envelope stress response protein [Oscillospiraceae bacterium]|jgi:uncharacterized alkaline shock family protein YloU